MAQIYQTQTHAKQFVNLLMQCSLQRSLRQSCQRYTDDKTQNLARMIQLLILQFYNLLLQMSVFQTKVESLKNYQKLTRKIKKGNKLYHKQNKINQNLSQNQHLIYMDLLLFLSMQIQRIQNHNIAAEIVAKKITYAQPLEYKRFNEKFLVQFTQYKYTLNCYSGQQFKSKNQSSQKKQIDNHQYNNQNHNNQLSSIERTINKAFNYNKLQEQFMRSPSQQQNQEVIFFEKFGSEPNRLRIDLQKPNSFQTGWQNTIQIQISQKFENQHINFTSLEVLEDYDQILLF